jgi:AcrR family transcriptional regulator
MTKEAAAPRRSDATKARILAAARETFARDGFDRATIRAIAAAARVDAALVMRYFGNKDGLFAAAAEFDLRLPDLATVPRQRLGRALVEHFLARWEGDPTDNGLRILLRTGVTSPEAAARMREIFARQLLPVVASAAPRGEADWRAGLIATQILGMALCRYLIELPAMAGMASEDVVLWLGPTIQRYLTAPRAPAIRSRQ